MLTIYCNQFYLFALLESIAFVLCNIPVITCCCILTYTCTVSQLKANQLSKNDIDC